MIIHSRFKRTSAGRVDLPQWISAPLGLADNQRAYVGCLGAHDVGCQLVFSALEARRWSDLWRLEIDFQDSPGILQSLFEILDELNIEVVCCESAVADTISTISLVCDCQNYQSPVDDDSQSRSRKDKVSLTGLTGILGAKFIADLHFGVDEGPRLRVKRLTAYRRAYAHSQQGILPVTVERRSVALPASVVQAVTQLTRTDVADGAIYSHTVETKDRLLYTFIASPQSGLFNFRVFVSKDVWVVAEVLGLLKSTGHNVLKSQLRYCTVDPHRVLAGDTTTFDTLDILASRQGGSGEEILATFREALNRSKSGSEKNAILDEAFAHDFLTLLRGSQAKGK